MHELEITPEQYAGIEKELKRVKTNPDIYKDGTRVFKINTEAGDGHTDGDTGRVIGSVELGGCVIYKIKWDDHIGDDELETFITKTRITDIEPKI